MAFTRCGSTFRASHGASEAQLQLLRQADIQIADLQGDLLGWTYQGSNLIQIDRDAGGLGRVEKHLPRR